VQQSRRCVETAGIEEDFVAVVVSTGDDGVGVGGHVGHRATLPATRRDDLDAAGHVGQRDDDESVTGPGEVVQAGVLIGGEDHLQLCCAGKEFVIVGGQQ
jgi:hypothetical protein